MSENQKTMGVISSRLYADAEDYQMTIYYDDVRILLSHGSNQEENDILLANSVENRDEMLASIHATLLEEGYKQLTKDKDVGGLTSVINDIMDELEGKTVPTEKPEKGTRPKTYSDMPEAEATAAMPMPDFSGMSKEDVMAAYYNLANNGLVPLIAEGLAEGLKVYKAAVKNDEAKDTNVSIEVDTDYGVMSLYYGEDDCEGDPFFRYSLGVTAKTCSAMLKAADSSFRHSLSNWFEDAVPKIPKNILKGMEITLWVPDVGGYPYLEL